jgi:hypothetical protein
MGGAAADMGIEALAGGTDMITVFDDFNHVMPSTTFGAATGDAATNPWEDSGWVMTDDASAPTAETISMNDPAVTTNDFNSCIQIYGGTGDDSGGNMQLDMINADMASAANNLTALSGRYNFPHMWIPETATIPSGQGWAGAAGDAGEGLDGTTWVFACRVGFRADWLGAAGDGDWEAKLFVGWAAAGDTSIMDHDTGAITTTNGNLHGFHINEVGAIDGISKRITADAMVENTNWVRMHAAGAVDNTVANGAAIAYGTVWYDLGLRMEISDMSLDTGNGVTTFYSRRVRTGVLGRWVQTGQLLNETPNHSVALVPTIEFLNGPTAGEDAGVLIDWWAFGRNRVSQSA